MSDTRLERMLAFRLAAAYDCWGHRRSVRTATQGGIWLIDASGFDHPSEPQPTPYDTREHRTEVLSALREAGVLTEIELATLTALVEEGMTLAQIAQRSGCSRQAVIARLFGNSKGQGGAAKKVRTWLLRRSPS